VCKNSQPFVKNDRKPQVAVGLFFTHTVYFDLYTVFRKKHSLTFSFISPWVICGFKQKFACSDYIPKYC